MAGMLLHYKKDKQIQVLGEGDESDEKPYSAWESAFQFSTIAFLLLWLFHFVSFVSPPDGGFDIPADSCPVLELHPSLLPQPRRAGPPLLGSDSAEQNVAPYHDDPLPQASLL